MAMKELTASRDTGAWSLAELALRNSDGVMCIVLRSPDPEGSSFAPAGSTDILAHDDAFFATFERTVSRDISRVGEVGLRLSHVDRYARTEHFPGDGLELTPDEMKREEHVYVYERT